MNFKMILAVCGWVVLSASLPACGKIMNSLASGGQNSPPAADPTQMQLKNSGGSYSIVPKTSLMSVDVTLYSQATGQTISQSFNGQEASQHLLYPIALNSPVSAQLSHMTITGDIVIHYESQFLEQNKELHVLNFTTLQDVEFPDTVYYSSRALDSDWLNQQ